MGDDSYPNSNIQPHIPKPHTPKIRDQKEEQIKLPTAHTYNTTERQVIIF